MSGVITGPEKTITSVKTGAGEGVEGVLHTQVFQLTQTRKKWSRMRKRGTIKPGSQNTVSQWRRGRVAAREECMSGPK